MGTRDLPCGCSIGGRTGTDLESCLLVYLKPSPARDSGQRGVLEKRPRTAQKPAAAFRDIQTYTAPISAHLGGSVRSLADSRRARLAVPAVFVLRLKLPPQGGLGLLGDPGLGHKRLDLVACALEEPLEARRIWP